MITVRIESRDREGRIVGIAETQAQSLVHNFARILQIQMSQVAASVQTIAGGWLSQSPHYLNFNASVVAGVARAGIVVGSVPDPVSITQATLSGIISHGTLAGQLLYQAVTFTVPSDSASLVQFQLSRVFLNRSGAPATISEVGIYSWVSGGTVMIDRTIPPTPITVPDGGQVTIVYTFRGTLG